MLTKSEAGWSGLRWCGEVKTREQRKEKEEAPFEKKVVCQEMQGYVELGAKKLWPCITELHR